MGVESSEDPLGFTALGVSDDLADAVESEDSEVEAFPVPEVVSVKPVVVEEEEEGVLDDEVAALLAMPEDQEEDASQIESELDDALLSEEDEVSNEDALLTSDEQTLL